MSISHVLTSHGVCWQLFDMGRCIRPLSQAEVEAFDQRLEPYRTPHLQHAWLAIVSWREDDVHQHSIVFAKLPLDELNGLDVSARDGFVRHWLSALASPHSDECELPYTFTPDTERMACFHAKAQRFLGLPHSAHYQTTLSYLATPERHEQWRELSVQGLADVTVNSDQPEVEACLMSALPNLPDAPKHTLLRLLENETPSAALAHGLLSQASKAPMQSWSLWVRALAFAAKSPEREAFLRQCLTAACDGAHCHDKTPHQDNALNKRALSIELLVTIASRCSDDLKGPLMELLLEALAIIDVEQTVFVPVVQDIMRQGELREYVMQAFRSPKRSDALSRSLSALMRQSRGT